MSLLLLLPNHEGDTDFTDVSSSSRVEESPGTLRRPKQNRYFMDKHQSRCWPAAYDVCLMNGKEKERVSPPRPLSLSRQPTRV